MSKRNGLNLAPIDFNTGVHLNAERDEFGLTKYWAVIEGDEITLLPHQYEALMNLAYYERKAERERIIKLLKQHDDSGWCGEANCPSPFPLDHLIALIKGENK